LFYFAKEGNFLQQKIASRIVTLNFLIQRKYFRCSLVRMFSEHRFSPQVRMLFGLGPKEPAVFK
jgi:hypothetical protein